MPQNTVLPQWRQDYQILAPAQKPSGVEVRQIVVPTGAAWAAGEITFTIPATTVPIGTQMLVTASGFTPAGYNGQFQGVVATATTITCPAPTTPGAQTALGQLAFMVLPSTAVPNQ